ncbi:Cep120 protein-domain-containing protein [Powellomyces hirtus]|nr:Cep120 protein-domain-containing protein [Powellomyces hirtus]
MARPSEHTVLVTVLEGRYFVRKANSKLYVQCRFNNEILTTDPVDHVPVPIFDTELAWDIDTKSLGFFRSQRAALKLIVYAVNPSGGKRDAIGYVMLELRGAPEEVEGQEKWYPLVNAKYSGAFRPEIKMSFAVVPAKTQQEEEVFEMQGRQAAASLQRRSKGKTRDPEPKRSSMQTSTRSMKTGVFSLPVDLHKDGYYQIGDGTSMWVLGVTIAFAENLELLDAAGKYRSSDAQDASTAGFYFSFTFLGNEITTEPFSELANPIFAAERVSIRLRCTTSHLRMFVDELSSLTVYLKSGNISNSSSNPILGFADISLRELSPGDMGLQDNGDHEKDAFLTVEKMYNLYTQKLELCMSDDARVPSIGVALAATPEESRSRQPSYGEHLSRSYDADFVGQLEKPSRKDHHDENVTHPDFGHAAKHDQHPESDHVPTEPDQQLPRPSSAREPDHHLPRPPSPIEPELRVPRPLSPAEPDHRLPRPSSPIEQDRRLPRPSSPIEQVRRLPRPSSPIEQDLRLPRPSSPNEHDRRLSRPSSPTEPDHRLPRPSFLTEHDRRLPRPSSPTEIERRLPRQSFPETTPYNPPSTAPPSSFGTTTTTTGATPLHQTQEYKVALELELWRAEQERLFRSHLRTRESQLLTQLAAEYRSREAALNQKLSAFQDVEQKLQDLAGTLEKRDRELDDRQKELELKARELEREVKARELEAKNLARRTVEECTHRLKREQQDAEDARRDRERERALTDSLRKEIEVLRKAQLPPHPPLLTTDKSNKETDAATIQRLTQKLADEKRGKKYYKTLWVRTLNELATYRPSANPNNRMADNPSVLGDIKRDLEVLKSFHSNSQNATPEQSEKVDGPKRNESKSEPQEQKPIDPKILLEVDRLAAERDSLLRSGVYNTGDRIVVELGLRIRELMASGAAVADS